MLRSNYWAPWWAYVLVIAPANMAMQQILPAGAGWWLAAVSTAATVLIGLVVVTAVYRTATPARRPQASRGQTWS